MPANHNWMAGAPWGLMCHYIDKPASSNVASVTTPQEWNRRVDAFDVQGFAGRVRATGAGYLIWTLGQNTGHFCAPNPVYDEYLGSEPSRLSQRDLIQELAAALAPEVRLAAYLPSHAPANHEAAVRALNLMPSWDASAWGLQKTWTDEEAADESLSTFQVKWQNVVEYWGRTWGHAVGGWWIDGCYFRDTLYERPEWPNFSSFASALRAGNPDRMLAFNSGTRAPFERLCAEQDYTAGEFSNRLPVHDTWTPLEATTDGMATHLLGFLGEYWGRGEPRFPTTLVQGYGSYLKERGVALTWDIPIDACGEVPDAIWRQLDALS